MELNRRCSWRCHSDAPYRVHPRFWLANSVCTGHFALTPAIMGWLTRVGMTTCMSSDANWATPTLEWDTAAALWSGERLRVSEALCF